MGKYGQAALKAVQLIQTKQCSSPNDAWEAATIEIFGEGKSGQKKGCPKNAFLGLCDEGHVRGINRGNYNNKENSENKKYAIRAVELLRQNPDLKYNSKELWANVMNGVTKSHNSQMDVVITLWENDLIVE